MTLLIVTQNVDSTDPILGFFHQWIEAFSERIDSVVVVGQKVGRHSFSSNVSVQSLRKEEGKSVIVQVLRSYGLFWKKRKDYDTVLVHMTPIWILIGAPLWILMRKRMYLWYEIKRGSWKLSLAMLLVRKVFAATEHGIPHSSKKLVVVGHGIDTEIFAKTLTHSDGPVVSLGRITRIKNYDVILRAFAELPADLQLFIAGGTVTDADILEEKRLSDLARELGIEDRVSHGWVAPDTVPDILQGARLFLHASQGGLDKAILQAMSCGCPCVSTSVAAKSSLPEECVASEDSMAAQAKALLELSDHDQEALSDELHSIVEHTHSLPTCIDRLVAEMQ
ncbi:hypothetical protein COU75_04425 [Candidatus Peregrinibacteria bacterium CG10_big_fil_rev_8_21_14_0_10_42_8]|nr:MAG: hypothetical protein COU75_04425 [Candidatus Peregrinibacteria bacterium CG10_big_fil_rev_8_21_14_0_10_42_8]